MLDLFDNTWAKKHTISLDNCIDVTLQVNYKLVTHGSFTHVVGLTRRLPLLLSVSQVSFQLM